MNQFTKRILIPLVVVAFLLGACAPAPAATQDPANSQQVIEQSVALTVAADSAQQKDQQLVEQAVALTVAAQNLQGTQQAVVATVPPTATIESPTAESVTLPSSSDLSPTPENVPLPTGSSQAAPANPNAPHIDSISPQEGSTLGGTVITITGNNFLSGTGGTTQFKFGKNAATSVKCDSTGSQCTAKTPPGVEGIVLVQALNFFDNVEEPVPSVHDSENSLDGFRYNEIRYNCGIMTVTPDNWNTYKGGAGFTIKWIIKNTGLSAWPAGLDFRFSGGVNMVNGSSIELPAIAPGDTYTAKFNGTAPKKAGKYFMTWSVQGMGCDAYLGVIVE